ncbi:ABC transporter ATP-binding protein [Euzebya tangerina]|uniref:ABC transporter ATP-binding protein n=1 Tax=Euzebya tangerina TaxID=591198 RepID=UPI00196AA769|nr:ATP-binding cassette domain-containing protein [Euzebya tangerina]
MLEIDNLHKRYGDITALDGCSFTVRPGRMLGFLGRNGAGKTTTMRAIFGLLTPDSGEVRWNGTPVGEADLARFGYMPEERGLYPKMRAGDQLAYLGRLHGMTKAQATAASEMWLTKLGLEERMGDPVEDLSQGNQQRVQLAAALIHDPELLVLDEPFNGLDPLGADTMASVLRERSAAGTAVVFSSHQLEVVEELCEDVAIIHEGSIRRTGEVQDLKDQAPYRRVELDLTGTQAEVLGQLDGVLESSFNGRHHVLKVRDDIDIQQLLRSVDTSAGSSHFVFTTPSLTDLFREAVSDDSPVSTTSAAPSEVTA